jgi:hypothetical protein
MCLLPPVTFRLNYCLGRLKSALQHGKYILMCVQAKLALVSDKTFPIAVLFGEVV